MRLNGGRYVLQSHTGDFRVVCNLQQERRLKARAAVDGYDDIIKWLVLHLMPGALVKYQAKEVRHEA